MFYVSLLEQDNTRKEQMNKFVKVPEFEPCNDKKYEIKAIQDSAVYTKEADGYLSGLYYLILQKSYLKEKNP